MKKIIAATDFSAAGTNAARYAAEMANALNAELHLYHVFAIPVAFSEISMNFDEYIRDAEQNLDSLKSELLQHSHLKLTIHTQVDTGVFFNQLSSRCALLMPYAVIIGSQGKTAGERILFGSESIYAMNHLTWPLITVPLKAKFKEIKSIGLAFDFSQHQDVAPFSEVMRLVHDLKTKLHVINTGKKLYEEEWVTYLTSKFGQTLARFQPVYHDIFMGSPDDRIVDFAIGNNLDLLMLIPKRQGILSALIYRNDAKEFMLHGTVPVMVLHD